MSTYNVHAGHSLVCRGASGFLDEVNEDRKVKNKVIELLRKEGHTVYDCTDDIGDERGNLANIVNKCNAHTVDMDISIHLNAGGGTGPEVWLYSEKLKDVAARISANIAKTFDLKDRGVKYSQKLYVLRNTSAPALLVECCFVDSEKDKKAWDADKCAKAIVDGILGRNTVCDSSTETVAPESEPAPPVRKQIHVIHQVLAKGKKWLSEVTDYNEWDSDGYSGYIGFPMLAFRAKTKGDASEVGYLEYRAHKKGGSWYGWRRDYNKDSAGDTFAGDGKSEIDGIQMRIVGISGRHVRYRVHVIGKGWLEWITDYGDGDNGYAGIYGYAIDAVQVEAV